MIRPKTDRTIYTVTKKYKELGKIKEATTDMFFTSVEEGRNPEDYYVGFTVVHPYREDAGAFGQGGTMTIPNGNPKPFGVQKIIETDKKWAPPHRWYPQPGNTGYDLLC